MASIAIAIQTTIFLPFARMRIGLHMMSIHLSLLDDGVMDLVAVLSCSLLPTSYRSFIQSISPDNGLNGTSIGQQNDHNDDQLAWAAQSFHHCSPSSAKGLVTGAAAIALRLIRMNSNVALSDLASCGTHRIWAKCFRRSGRVPAPNGWAEFNSTVPGTITYRYISAPVAAIKARDEAKKRSDSTEIPYKRIFDALGTGLTVAAVLLLAALILGALIGLADFILLVIWA